MLEALCFALTDLGLRTDWDMNDQLVSYAGGKDLGQDFYAQQEILPNYPWTPLDFRKLIIDFPEMVISYKSIPPLAIAVQNVWLYRAIPAEVQISAPQFGKMTKKVAMFPISNSSKAQQMPGNGDSRSSSMASTKPICNLS